MKLKTLAYLSLIALVALLGPAINAQTFSVIHAFGGVEGANPEAGVTIRGGVLYGTTSNGGNGQGSAYQLTDVGNNWVAAPIFIFSNIGNGGIYPEARVVFGPDGHLYGTTSYGGSENQIGGTIFNLTPPFSICKTANCFWKENVVHQFQGGKDGSFPTFGDLVWDAQGNMYGTTDQGGAPDDGTVYELQPSGNSWTESVIYSFSGPDGSNPYNAVTLDDNGNLFGTTRNGGLQQYNSSGTVFELAYSPGGGWTESVLYSFQNVTDGRWPVSGLVFDTLGNLYGTTSDGGAGGGGTVFELSPSGNTWTFTLLYSFSGTPGEFCGPYGTLTMGSAGSLYGTTICDGANGFGNIFKLTNTGNGWVYNSLYDFTNGNDGEFPRGNLTFDADGNFYGTAESGGAHRNGVVWMIKP